MFTNYSGSSNFYIADNYFIGRDDPDHRDRLVGRFLGEIQRQGRPEIPAR